MWWESIARRIFLEFLRDIGEENNQDTRKYITWAQLEPYWRSANDALRALTLASERKDPAYIMDRLIIDFEAKYKAFDMIRTDPNIVLYEPSTENIMDILRLKEDYEYIILGIPYPDHNF